MNVINKLNQYKFAFRKRLDTSLIVRNGKIKAILISEVVDKDLT